jgi:HAD superfamily hydrolase (TIGR01549 family)
MKLTILPQKKNNKKESWISLRGMLRFNHVIWDFDGTLFNTYPHIASVINEIIQKDFHCDTNVKQIQNWCEESLNYCFDKIATCYNVNKMKLQDSFNHTSSINIEFHQVPFSGAIEMIQFVRDYGGKNYIITHRGPITLNRLLEYNKMTSYFERIITHEDGFPNKPDPASFLFLMGEYKMSKEDVIAIGDRDIDIHVARNSSIKSCYFNPEGKTHELADYNIKNLLDLKTILKI